VKKSRIRTPAPRRRRFRTPKCSRGFTVVEVLVSIAIFGILIIGMLAAFSGAFAATLKAGRVDRGVAAAADEISKALSDAGYTSENLDSTPAVITLTLPGGQTVVLTVDKITGTAVTDDGLVVEFVTFSQTSGD
jgi:prepilin-type N-terminal cleavage/methylation domain-containing protein